MEAIIQKIVTREYDMMIRINNIGGPASCQSQTDAFSLMRTSQFQVWTDVMLESYLGGLIDAEASGRNLLFEKYAWMMEHSLPDAFAQVRHALPVLPPEQLAEVEECVAMEAVWAEECARRYPALARHGRPLRTVQDTPEQTSMETYNRGELRTYSRRTLTLYRDFLYTCRARGQNLAMEVRTHQLHAQGFASLEAAEAALS